MAMFNSKLLVYQRVPARNHIQRHVTGSAPRQSKIPTSVGRPEKDLTSHWWHAKYMNNPSESAV